MNRKTIAVLGALLAGGGGGAVWLSVRPSPLTPSPVAPPDAATADAGVQVDANLARLAEVLAAHRKLIVLFAPKIPPAARAEVNRVGQLIFHDNQARLAVVEDELGALVASAHPARFAPVREILNWIESGPGLYDADRLAFRETLRALRDVVATDQTLDAVKIHMRISEDLDALAEIEKLYEKELKQVFGRFGARGMEIERQRWSDYTAKLALVYSREGILKEYGIILPYPEKRQRAIDERTEFSGRGLPDHTVVLTFDDGPHATYTEEVAAILKQYDVPGIFFQVGKNLGSVDGKGLATLGRLASKARDLIKAGFVLGNHSFTHAQLPKKQGESLKREISFTDALLTALDPQRAALFRFPYGARSDEGMDVLGALNLKSVMWNIDSLDWADPVPSSIAGRVLEAVEREKRGIILFHDIHERTTRALPLVIERLQADGYRFATWNGKAFVVNVPSAGHPAARAAPTSGYEESWAAIVGIDEYQQWPRLEHAVRDADAVQSALVNQFGFAPDHVFTLRNGEATRANILALLNDKLGAQTVQRDDRVFVFFAGHGSTRKLSSGRDLGYIIPVDSDPAGFATDAIAMTELQNVAEGIAAKHLLFVMDSCYSGLGLTRGGARGNFLLENARRVGRQMLTAGGADQMVADGGPNGHSVFTWTLLQALSGKGDLNLDGFITATELAAYVAPAVAGVSRQTPAFGSLPGSEGGEFVFEPPPTNEFLSLQTTQLDAKAIALNEKLDARTQNPDAGPANAAVMVKNLEGGDQALAAPVAAQVSQRRAAQLANERGLTLYREARYADAEAQFTEALKLRPDFALAANNLGFVFHKQGRYVEAARWFDNAIKLDPSRAIAHLNLGDACQKSGDVVRAKQAYATYLALNPAGPRGEQLRALLASP